MSPEINFEVSKRMWERAYWEASKFVDAEACVQVRTEVYYSIEQIPRPRRDLDIDVALSDPHHPALLDFLAGV